MNFLKKVRELINDGYITKNNAKIIKEELENLEVTEDALPFAILSTLRKHISEEDLKIDTKCIRESENEVQEIILSEYFH